VDQSGVITLNDVPDLALSEARAEVEKNPHNVSAYLALARAAWGDNRITEAQSAIMDGAKVTDDKVVYFLTAANIADQVSRQNAAVVMYSQALTEAQGDSVRYPAVRAMAGEYLYRQALIPQSIRLDELIKFQEAYLGFEPHPLFEVMVVRSRLTNDRPNMAELAFRRLPAGVAGLGEARLVLGELLEAQSKIQQAKSEWEAVVAMPDIPDWVRARAEALLSTKAGD
jgi:hypothetical protein